MIIYMAEFWLKTQFLSIGSVFIFFLELRVAASVCLVVFLSPLGYLICVYEFAYNISLNFFWTFCMFITGDVCLCHVSMNVSNGGNFCIFFSLVHLKMNSLIKLTHPPKEQISWAGWLWHTHSGGRVRWISEFKARLINISSFSFILFFKILVGMCVHAPPCASQIDRDRQADRQTDGQM